mgnify:CR=1 FL=1
MDEFNKYVDILKKKIEADDFTQDPERPVKKKKVKKLKQNEIFLFKKK